MGRFKSKKVRLLGPDGKLVGKATINEDGSITTEIKDPEFIKKINDNFLTNLSIVNNDKKD